MRIKNIIANIIIVILCAAVIVTGTAVIRSYHQDTNNYYTKEFSLIDELQWGSYEGLLEKATRVEVMGGKLSQDTQECIAVAKYYNAAFYYKMYAENNETEKAAKKLELMKKQREAAGELEYLLEDIDKMLAY